MRDHVILCGSDGLAARVLEELRALGEEVVLIADDPNGLAVARAHAIGVEPMIADWRHEGALVAAGGLSPGEPLLVLASREGLAELSPA